jgi:hypothetical protein
MQLKDLANKPQLKEMIIDSEELVAKYGDSLQFFIHDRLPIETYTKLASIKSDDAGEMYSIIKDFILDENGHPIMSDGNVLPMDVMIEAVTKLTDFLGK